MNSTKRGTAVIRIMRLLLLIPLVSGILSLALAALLTSSIIGVRIYAPSLELFFYFFWPLMLIATYFVFIYLIAIGISWLAPKFERSKLIGKHGSLEEKPKPPRWSYETRHELRRLVDVSMLVALVFSLALVFFLKDSYPILSNPGVLLALGYLAVFPIVSIHAHLRKWSEAIDGAVFFLDRFLQDLDKTSERNLRSEAFDRLDYFKNALDICSHTYPSSFKIATEELCSQLQEFLVSPNSGNVNVKALISNDIRQFRDRLNGYDLQGAWIDLLAIVNQVSGSSGKSLALMVHEKPLLTRLWQTIKSEKFWVVTYSATFLFYFFLSIMGWPFGIRI